MGRSQTTFQKRQRELQKIRKREQKAEKRRVRRDNNTAEREHLSDAGVDPDLVGIVPGPHNNQGLADDIELEMDGVGGVLISKKKPVQSGSGGTDGSSN
ncbi:MAG: hypothetical protein KJO07_25205 [Deltaproteobacteria bacterium]|jgi:hypothetical protein|nr:hypothetical protein [Deltaproteobacteria bacterium]